jgi:hypothetical protein
LEEHMGSLRARGNTVGAAFWESNQIKNAADAVFVFGRTRREIA